MIVFKRLLLIVLAISVLLVLIETGLIVIPMCAMVVYSIYDVIWGQSSSGY